MEEFPNVTNRKTVHLVCNAHLDPVWQWTWEDGLAEAISTFRVAADFCERLPDFKFNHNESLLYGWTLKHDPALFRRIQKLVKRGRWHIAGGAYLQPDVNTPSGESHIRQFLLGLKFFTRHFKRRPTTAYNFDPFGHPEGFVQILAGCGMDSYIFCRPDYGTFDLPVGTFRWMDRSGAMILARRGDDHYLSRPGTDHEIPRKFARFLEHYQNEPVTMLLWGIGNHGGGVSRQELAQIRSFAKAHPQYRLIHSTPEAYFQAVVAHARLNPQGLASLPEFHGEMEESFAGCYTSMSRVKRAHRAAEHLIQQTERLTALAWWLGDASYPAETLDACWRDILFCEFHDILPGSGVPRVEQDALAVLNGAQDRLRRVRFDLISRLVRGERRAREGEVPIFVTNPHGFAVTQPVEFEYGVGPLGGNDKAIRLRHAGRDIPFQRISAQHNLGGQDIVRLVVPLSLKPFEIRRLDASLVDGHPMQPQPLTVTTAPLRLTGPCGTVTVNPRTGLIDAIVPSGGKRSLVRPGAMQPVLFKDLNHSWTCGDPGQLQHPMAGPQAPAWKKIDARFRLATPEETARLSPLACDRHPPTPTTHAQPVRVVEHGPCRTTIEALFVCEESYINRHYVFCHHTGRIEIRDHVVCNHKDSMLKLFIPLAFAPDHSRSESLFSVARRKPTADYVERHHQRWVAAVSGQGNYLAVINDGSFAHNLTHDALALNVLRTPPYTSFGIQPNDPFNDRCFAPRQDQGEHDVRYLLQWGNDVDEGELTRLADGLNAEPFAYVYYPDGKHYDRSHYLTQRCPVLAVAAANVRIVAVKRAERGSALVVRLQELAGRHTRTRLVLAGRAVTTTIPAFGLTTLLLKRRGSRLSAQSCNLVEGL